MKGTSAREGVLGGCRRQILQDHGGDRQALRGRRTLRMPRWSLRSAPALKPVFNMTCELPLSRNHDPRSVAPRRSALTSEHRARVNIHGVRDPHQGANGEVHLASLDLLVPLVPDVRSRGGLLLGQLGALARSPNASTDLFEDLTDGGRRHRRDKARWLGESTPQYNGVGGIGMRTSTRNWSWCSTLVVMMLASVAVAATPQESTPPPPSRVPSAKARLLYEDAVKTLNHFSDRDAEVDYRVVEERFGKVLKEDPAMAEAEYILGILAERQGKQDTAAVHFATAERLDPQVGLRVKRSAGIAREAAKQQQEKRPAEVSDERTTEARVAGPGPHRSDAIAAEIAKADRDSATFQRLVRNVIRDAEPYKGRPVKWHCRIAKITSTIVNCNKSGSYDDVVFLPNGKVVAAAKPVEGDEVVFEATIDSGYRANESNRAILMSEPSSFQVK